MLLKPRVKRFGTDGVICYYIFLRVLITYQAITLPILRVKYSVA